MRTYGSIFRESFTLALWIALAVAGWQTALAADSMPLELSSFPRWVHFCLYSLGGFAVMAFTLLVPAIIAGLISALFRKVWDAESIRRFLLSITIGVGIIVAAIILRPAMMWSLVASGGLGASSAIVIAGIVLGSFLVGAALAHGALAMFESLSATAQWSIMWGWWLFMVTVAPIMILLSSFVTQLYTWTFTLIVSVIMFFILRALLPAFHGWMRRKGAVRWTLGVALLGLVYLLTIPVPPRRIPGRPSGPDAPPVVLITIDTLRADALGCYPQGDMLRLGSPNIDRIANEGTLFEYAYSTAPWTLPSVGSILSGLPPKAHGALDEGRSALAPGAMTVAEVLKDAGYATGGFVVNGMLGPDSGMDKGFDIYDEEVGIQRLGRRLIFQRVIDRVRLPWPEPLTPNDNPFMERDAVRRACAFIRAHSTERFFLWLHLFSPHSKWYPPREYRMRAEEQLGIVIPRQVITQQQHLRNGSRPITPSDLRAIEALYAGEVAFADDNVGKIIGELEAAGIFDNCVFIVSSDHGEEFYEHDRIEHGHSLYPELLQVPLVIRHPGSIPTGTRIPGRVSLVDLPPTILDLARIDPSLWSQSVEFTGQSLAPLIVRAQSTSRPVFFEDPLSFDRQIEGVIDENYLYIGGTDIVLHPRLYDLDSDPEAWYDILREYPEIGDAMAGLLVEYDERCASIAERIGAGASPGMRERFRSLGYIN